MKILVDYAQNQKCKLIECEAIDVNGHINSKKLLENFGFVEQYEIKNCWGGEIFWFWLQRMWS